MKSNFESLSTLAQEIERQQDTKLDWLATADNLTAEDESITIKDQGQYSINNFCHGQFAAKLGIPKQYYDKMIAVPGLRAQNINGWLGNVPEKKFLVRTLDGKARAFLSDRYRPLDNYDIMQTAFLPVLDEYKGDIRVKTNCLTETRMYIQILFPRMSAVIKAGDIVQAGVVMRNSEVGAGALDILSMIWTLVCGNGMIASSILKKYHVGRKIDLNDEVSQDIYKDDTIKAELESYKLQIRDVFAHALTGAIFRKQVENLRKANENIISEPKSVVENVTKKYNLTDWHSKGILNNMIKEGNINQYGLANGITALAHDIENADAQYDMEVLGSRIIELPRSEWKVLASNAA